MTADTAGTAQAGKQPGTAVPHRAPRLGLALVVISMAQLMLVLDELIVNTALPHIQQALHFSGTGLEWVVTGYAVTFGGLLMLGGRAGDILGRRRMFSAGILIFTLASLLGGFATTSWLLITARVLQGTGAAVAAPAALSLIAVTFPEGRLRTRALGVRYAQRQGARGLALALGAIIAAMPMVMEELAIAAGQRLVQIVSIEPGAGSRSPTRAGSRHRLTGRADSIARQAAC